MIVVDTSALIDALCGPRRSLPRLTQLVESGERLNLSTIVLYEWLRGPRLPQELEVQEKLFPGEQVFSFGVEEAMVAADLYRHVSRARGREVDLAIAATAITRDAAIWTLNPDDFHDIRGLRLI